MINKGESLIYKALCSTKPLSIKSLRDIFITKNLGGAVRAIDDIIQQTDCKDITENVG